MINARRITKRVVTVLVLLVMGLFIMNTTLFTHTHIMPDGRVVTHAHPVNDRSDPQKDNSAAGKQGTADFPAGQHNHTSVEYMLLDHSLAELILFAVAALLVLAALPVVFRIPNLPYTQASCPITLTGRAPPAW